MLPLTLTLSRWERVYSAGATAPVRLVIKP
jgi:hypothetical protein